MNIKMLKARNLSLLERLESSEVLAMADPSISKACTDILYAEASLENAKSALKLAKETLHNKSIDYINSATSKHELINRLSYLYWDVPILKLSAFEEALGCTGAALRKMIIERIGEIKCKACNVIFNKKFNSRSTLQFELENGALCPNCIETHKDDSLPKITVVTARNTDRLFYLQHCPYPEYLESPEWKSTRMKKLQQTGFVCQQCGATERLEVHHMTYERRGHELMSDLAVVCHGCHAKLHGKD